MSASGAKLEMKMLSGKQKIQDLPTGTRLIQTPKNLIFHQKRTHTHTFIRLHITCISLQQHLVD
jgi:hypothetical protein